MPPQLPSRWFSLLWSEDQLHSRGCKKKPFNCTIFFFFYKIEIILYKHSPRYVCEGSLLETWTPALAHYTLQAFILVEWPSHQGCAVVAQTISYCTGSQEINVDKHYLGKEASVLTTGLMQIKLDEKWKRKKL